MFPAMHLLPENNMFSSVLSNVSDRLLSSKAVGRGSPAPGSAGRGLFSAQITRKDNGPGALRCGSLLPCREQR